MLNYEIIDKPFIDPDKLVFNRGQYQFESLEEISERNPAYILFLAEGRTDEASCEILQEFIEEHPDYFEGVEF